MNESRAIITFQARNVNLDSAKKSKEILNKREFVQDVGEYPVFLMDFRNYLRMILLQNDGVMAKLGSENIDKNDLVFTRPLRAAFLN